MRPPLSPTDTLGFIGDFCPDELAPGQRLVITEALSGVLRGCDLLVANLECPLTEAPSRKADGIPLQGSPGGAETLKDMGVGLANLANNHISDCGEAGLDESLAVLRSNGIPHVGAGMDLADASEPFLFPGRSGPVAFLSISYSDLNATSMASEAGSGANPLELDRALGQIRRLREEGARVVVSFHGGWEFYRIPSKAHRSLMRALSGAGAALVIGHHGHVFLGREVWDDGFIFYGLGDFFLRVERNQRVRGTTAGLGLILEMDEAGPVALSVFFVGPDYERNTVGLITGRSVENLRRVFSGISRVLETDLAHSRAWRLECAKVVSGMNERGGPSLRGTLTKVRDSFNYLGWLLSRPKADSGPRAPDDPTPTLSQLALGALLGLPNLMLNLRREKEWLRLTDVDPRDVA